MQMISVNLNKSANQFTINVLSRLLDVVYGLKQLQIEPF